MVVVVVMVVVAVVVVVVVVGVVVVMVASVVAVMVVVILVVVVVVVEGSCNTFRSFFDLLYKNLFTRMFICTHRPTVSDKRTRDAELAIP